MKIIWDEFLAEFVLQDHTIFDALLAFECEFDFDSASSTWRGDAAAIKRLRDNRVRLSGPLTISELALQRYKEAGQRVLTAVEESRAEDSDIIIPVPKGLNPATGLPYEYMPFQKAGIAYALKRPDTLIGDDPGLGKTMQAIGFVNCLTEARRVLVISPAFLKPMWRKKWLEWDVKGLSVGIAEGTIEPVLPTTDVVIINYEILKHYRKQLCAIEWDVMIGDEIHKLKNAKAQRTQAVFGGGLNAKRRIFLTGTPTLNGKPKELWPILEQVDPDGLGRDWFTYAKRYCGLFKISIPGKRIGYIWDGATNLPELQERMREKFLVRRLKGNVLKELPPKTRVIIPFAVSGIIARKLDKEIQAFEKYTGGNDDAYFEMPSFGNMSTEMLETGLKMVKPTIEIVKSDLEEQNKIVVMCYHNQVAEEIYKAFKTSTTLLVNGTVDPSKRYALTQRFQNEPEITVLVGTIESCSEGLEMFAASEMIFPERSWKPGSVTQAEDRIHRKGQREACLYKHLVLEGSLAERQTIKLIAKQNRADAMLDKEVQ